MGIFTKQASKHGARMYLSPDDILVAKGGLASGGEQAVGNVGGNIVLPSPNRVALWDDFLGDLVADEWAYVEGDTGHSGALVTGTGGVFRLLSSNTTATLDSSSNHALTSGLFLNWKAHQGPSGKFGSLTFAARAKLESVSRTVNRQHVFIGLSDSGGAEFPIYDTGAGLIANATDLIGFIFSPGGDTGWSLVTVQNGGTAQVVAVDTGVVANVYDVLEFELVRGPGDTGGTVYAKVNGEVKGKISNPVTGTVALTPWIGQWPQDTGGRFVDVDYVNVSAPRDTGL